MSDTGVPLSGVDPGIFKRGPRGGGRAIAKFPVLHFF